MADLWQLSILFFFFFCLLILCWYICVILLIWICVWMSSTSCLIPCAFLFDLTHGSKDALTWLDLKFQSNIAWIWRRKRNIVIIFRVIGGKKKKWKDFSTHLLTLTYSNTPSTYTHVLKHTFLLSQRPHTLIFSQHLLSSIWIAWTLSHVTHKHTQPPPFPNTHTHTSIQATDGGDFFLIKKTW